MGIAAKPLTLPDRRTTLLLTTYTERRQRREKGTHGLYTGKVDSGDTNVEKAEAIVITKEASLNMHKDVSQQHNGDSEGNNLNCGDKVTYDQPLYGENVGDIRHTVYQPNLSSLQTQSCWAKP